jgi:ketosteroid isomerase-like protein
MSQEDVDLVVGLIQPGPQVDFVPLFRNDDVWAAAVERLAPLYDPDSQILVHGLPGGDRTYVGVVGMRTAWLDWLAPWASYRAEVHEAVDLGDRVLLLYRSFGRLGPDAPEVPAELASVWTVRDGKIVHAEFFATTHAEARKALGLVP